MNNKLTRMVWGAVLAVAGLMCIPANTEASQTFNFSPTPISLENLPHAFYYTWGINFNLPATERITGETLTFYNIFGWKMEGSDVFFTHLLDNPASSVIARKDYPGGGDYFDEQGVGVNEVMKKCKGVPK